MIREKSGSLYSDRVKSHSMAADFSKPELVNKFFKKDVELLEILAIFYLLCKTF